MPPPAPCRDVVLYSAPQLISFVGSKRIKLPFFLPRIIMKLCSNQSIPVQYLKGACIFLSDEDEGRYIKDVCVDLDKHSIILVDDNGDGMYWESLHNASIQLGGR